jgi:hypothetical protein
VILLKPRMLSARMRGGQYGAGVTTDRSGKGISVFGLRRPGMGKMVEFSRYLTVISHRVIGWRFRCA